MKILFANDYLRDQANSFRQLAEQYGTRKAKRIRQRLDEINAANNLADFEALPAIQCHQIDGHEGLIAVNTVTDSQLLLQIIERLDLGTNGNLDWKQVTAVKIINLDGQLS